MAEEQRIWKMHFGRWRDEEVVIAGHKESINQVLLVRLNALPADEKEHLVKIAASEAAQQEDYLVNILERVNHKSNRKWVEHIFEHLRRGNSAFQSVSLKDVQEMNQVQKNFFKGYGEPVNPANRKEVRLQRRLRRENDRMGVYDSTNPSTDLYETMTTTTSEPVSRDAIARAPKVVGVPEADAVSKDDPDFRHMQQQASGGAADHAVMGALQSLAESQAAMTAALLEMSSKLGKPKATRKKATKKKVAAKKVDVSGTEDAASVG
jgi:hypothetical protein